MPVAYEDTAATWARARSHHLSPRRAADPKRPSVNDGRRAGPKPADRQIELILHRFACCPRSPGPIS
jgi:hypothetical protein